MFWKLFGSVGLLFALMSCGGGSTSSTEPVDGDAGQVRTHDSQHGTPQDSVQIQAMAKRLSTYFGSKKTSLTDSTAAVPYEPYEYSKTSKLTESAPSAKGFQQKGLTTYRRTHRFLNTRTAVHFYTSSDTERQHIQATLPHFKYEGTAYRVMAGPADFAVPVYRFYNRVSGTHLYTASESEKNKVIRELGDIYTFEGGAWFARPDPYPGWVPVYRFFNRQTGTHFYTHNEVERAHVLAALPHYVLEGVAYWVRSDAAVNPQTWQPPAGATPDVGNYVYFESQAGDFVGLGEQHLWTAADSRIQMINRYDKILELAGEGYSKVGGYLFFPSALSEWKVGFYPNATRANWVLNTAQPNPGPGLDFSMGGRSCNETTGWIYIDSVSHDPDGSLAAFELRFEQLCQWSTDVLRGKVRWSKYDTVMPPGPLVPAPNNLWRPATGVVPDNGSFMYLEGSGIRNGLPHAYTRLLRGSDTGPGQLGFSGQGMTFGGLIQTTTTDELLWFSFQTPWFLPRLVPGQYRNVTRTPSANPARGNLDFYYSKSSNPYESWTCGGGQWSDGWFVVDEVNYVDDAIANIQLRFERWCLGSPEVTRGMIRWQAGD